MLELKGITKSYTPGNPVLRDINLSVAAGDIVCLLGPSGCGKTTLLRVVAGLEKLDSGAIFFDQVNLAPVEIHKRNFGFMFQEYALFPHKSVGQNVAFGLRMADWPAAEIKPRVAEMLDLVDLQGYAERTIFELSGGERQRVALARSLAPNPRLLMLDEPLGSLDRSLREELMTELRIILKEIGVTALYVTHDQEEAFAIADQIVLLNAGKIEQSGPPAEVYAQPNSEFAARFLGFQNLLTTQIHATDPSVARTSIGPITLLQPSPVGTHTLLIRPDALILLPAPQPDAHSAVVRTTSFRGDHVRVQLDATTGVTLTVQLPVDVGVIQTGETLYFRVDPKKVVLLG